MEERTLEVNGVPYAVSVHVERRRTVRASIGRKGVTIRLPSHLRPADRTREIERLLGWARRRLGLRPVRSASDGATLVVWGVPYVLRLLHGRGTSARIVGREIRLRVETGTPPELREEMVGRLLSRCLGRKHRETVERRLEELNRLHFRVSYGRVTLRDTRSTWGSCSARGNLSFSTRLLLAPREVADYVLVHELAHRIVPNHSASFWALVRRALPDFEERRKWLRRHGAELDL